MTHGYELEEARANAREALELCLPAASVGQIPSPDRHGIGAGEHYPDMMRRYEVSSEIMLMSFEQSGFVIVASKSHHHYLVHKDDPRRRAIIPLDLGYLST